MAPHWLVFLDESGDFCDAGDLVGLGGLALRSDAVLRPHEIRTVIRQALPWVPLPPHAAHLRMPAFHLALWMGADELHRRSFPDAAREGLAAAELLVASSVTPAVKTFRDRARRSASIDFGLLRWVHEWIRARSPTVAAELASLCDRYLHAMKTVLGALGGELTHGPVFLIAAFATPLVDASAVLTAPARYGALATALFAGIQSLTEGHGEAASGPIWVHSAMPWFPCASWRSTVEELRTWWRAARAPLQEPSLAAGAPARLLMPLPVAYDKRSPPGLYLADFVINRLRGELRGRRRPFSPLVIEPLLPDSRWGAH